MCLIKYPLAKQLETRSPISLSLDELEPIDLPLRLTSAPFHLQGIVYGCKICVNAVDGSSGFCVIGGQTA